MSARCPISAIVVTVILPLVASADEPGPGEVERQLRAQGLVPMKAPPACSQDDPNPRYWVSGDIAKPVITLTRREHAASQTSLRGKRFEYSSVDHGEFGGSLNVSQDRGKPRVLLDANVIHLLPAGDDLFVFSGSAHLGSSVGAVHIIENYDTAPSLQPFTRLPAKPDVIAMDPRTWRIVVVTETSVSEIWAGFYNVITARQHRFPHATSALVSWPNFLIGHCGGVALLELPWRRHRPPALDHSDQITIVSYWTRR
jgi:hypothetical protein